MWQLERLENDRPRAPRDSPILRPDWDRAACTSTFRHIFFTRHGMKHRSAADNAARTVCLDCPIQPDCLAWALAYEPDGTWGGVTAPDRWKLGGVKPRSKEAIVEAVSAETAARTCERLVKRGHDSEIIANALDLAARLGTGEDCPSDGVGLSLVVARHRRAS